MSARTKHPVAIAAVCILSSQFASDLIAQNYPFNFPDGEMAMPYHPISWWSSQNAYVMEGSNGSYAGARISTMPVSGIVSIDATAVTTSITLNGPGPVGSWSYTASQSISSGVFPNRHTYNTSLTVSFSLDASTLSIASGPVTPVLDSGTMYHAAFSWNPIPIPLSWSYSLVENGTQIESGNGVTGLTLSGVNVQEDVGGYPNSLSISIGQMTYNPDQYSIVTVSPPHADPWTIRTPYIFAQTSEFKSFASEAVPEPQHYAIMTGAGLAGLCLARKRGWLKNPTRK